VAIVAGAAITKAEYDRYVEILKRSGGKGQVSEQAMAALLQSAWVMGEAKRLGIALSEGAVEGQLAQTDLCRPAEDPFSLK